MENTGRDVQSYFPSTWMSNRTSNPRNIKGSLVKRGLVTCVYLGGALFRTPRPELDRTGKASLSESYRLSPLTAPNSRILFDPPEKFPLPHIGLLWMRHATGLAAAGSQIFVIFSQDHSTSQPFPPWVPPSSVQLDSLSEPRFDFESANMGRGGGKFKVCFFLLFPFLSLGGTCDGDSN